MLIWTRSQLGATNPPHGVSPLSGLYPVGHSRTPLFPRYTWGTEATGGGPKLITGRAKGHYLLAWPLACDLPTGGELLQSLSSVGMIVNLDNRVELWH